MNDGPQVLPPVLDVHGTVATLLRGTLVPANNIPAPILYSISTQVGFQIPYEVARQDVALVVVQVSRQFNLGRAIGLRPLRLGSSRRNRAGTGAASVLHEDGVTAVTPQSPAKRNEAVLMQTTG